MKLKFACFSCRKMFRIDPERYDRDEVSHWLIIDLLPVCPDCGMPMRFVWTRFRPPRRIDKQAWEVAELLYGTAHRIYWPWPWRRDYGFKGIARAGQAKRYIEANPHYRSKGAELLVEFKKRTGK